MKKKKDVQKAEEKKVDPVIVTHHEARRDYFVLESMEAGIVLKGSEVKGLRDGKAGLSGSFARFEKGELYIYNLYIAPYEKAGLHDRLEPSHPRKLLLHHSQLERLQMMLQTKSVTLIPLKMYWNRYGIAKVEIAVAKGKKLWDKRADIKKSVVNREIDRAIKNRNQR